MSTTAHRFFLPNSLDIRGYNRCNRRLEALFLETLPIKPGKPPMVDDALDSILRPAQSLGLVVHQQIRDEIAQAAAEMGGHLDEFEALEDLSSSACLIRCIKGSGSIRHFEQKDTQSPIIHRLCILMYVQIMQSGKEVYLLTQ